MASDPSPGTPVVDSTRWTHLASNPSPGHTRTGSRIFNGEEQTEFNFYMRADSKKDRDEETPDERVPFLSAGRRDEQEEGVLVEGRVETKSNWRKASIHWLAPFALFAAICRGMTLAPRVEVYTQLSCLALRPHINISIPNNVSSVPIPISNRGIWDPPSLDRRISYLDFDTLSMRDFSARGGNESVIYDPYALDDPYALPEPSKECTSDPEVGSSAARLQTAVTITMGILSAITTPLWGQSSDSHGRTRILAIAAAGLFFTDIVFIVVCRYRGTFSRWLLMVGPVVEGLLGGWTTMQAAINAYASDATPKEMRSKIFSRFFGLIYVGVALGPAISGFFIKHTRSLTSVFYLSASSWAILVLLMLFILPESLSPEHRDNIKARNWRLREGGKTGRKWWHVAEPLGIFWPRKSAKKGGGGRDWNLTLVGMASFFMLLVYGIYHMKFQYAIYVYSWNAEQLGYYLAYIGAARAVHLLILLPAIIRFIRPAGQSPLKGDHHLALGSVLLDFCAYSLTSLSPASSAPAFVLFTSMSSFAGGAMPAMHAIALGVLTAQEKEAEGEGEGGSGEAGEGETNHAGRMFGAFGLVQATSSMLVGPLMFGAVYSVTVYSFAKAIFVLAAGLLLTTFLCLCGVRVGGIDWEGEHEHA